jgi:hypothetical protein
VKVEVRNVKEMRSLSEETLCFSCTVVIDGVVAGTASNRGSGGANEYHPYALQERLTAYAATLPPIDIDGDKLPQDADTALSEVVNDFLAVRDYRKAVKNRILVLNDKGQIRETRPVPKGEDVHAIAQRFATKPGIVKVLNLMPETEAVALLKAQAHA